MNYRTTRIYLRSLDLIDLVARVVRTLPPGYAFLADQIRRSSSSVPLNYLEGCGRSGAADRRRFFAISKLPSATPATSSAITSSPCCGVFVNAGCVE